MNGIEKIPKVNFFKEAQTAPVEAYNPKQSKTLYKKHALII
jgi:hypothetical protein